MIKKIHYSFVAVQDERGPRKGLSKSKQHSICTLSSHGLSISSIAKRATIQEVHSRDRKLIRAAKFPEAGPSKGQPGATGNQAGPSTSRHQAVCKPARGSAFVGVIPNRGWPMMPFSALLLEREQILIVLNRTDCTVNIS